MMRWTSSPATRAGATSGAALMAPIGRPTAAATGQDRLGSRAVPPRAQPHPVRPGVREPAVVRAVSRGPQQEVELQVVVAPLLDRAAREIEEPLPGRRMGPVERVDPAAPLLAGVPDDRRASVGALQEPV